MSLDIFESNSGIKMRLPKYLKESYGLNFEKNCVQMCCFCLRNILKIVVEFLPPTKIRNGVTLSSLIFLIRNVKRNPINSFPSDMSKFKA